MKTAKKKEITKLFKDIKIELDKGKYPGPPCTFIDNIRKPGEPIRKDIIKYMRPDSIDNNHFWKSISNTFGTLAVTNTPNLSIEEANEATLNISKDFGLLDRVESQLVDGVKILEIGSGHGNFHNWLKSKCFDMSNYYSIDVHNYFEHENLHITDGNTFPEELPQFDIIYSCNVFQHLTQKQRDMYYENISEHLNGGGIFYGSNTMKHPNNLKFEHQGRSIWGMKDEDGNDYVAFFGQYTEVEDSTVFVNKMRNLGFKTQLITMSGNFITFESRKLWTIN